MRFEPKQQLIYNLFPPSQIFHINDLETELIFHCHILYFKGVFIAFLGMISKFLKIFPG